MLEGNLDDFVSSQVGADWGVLPALSNGIGLIGLLPVHAKSVLMTENGDSVEGKLVSCSKDPDSYEASKYLWVTG